MFNKNDSINLTLPENLSFEFKATTKNGSVSVPFNDEVSKKDRTTKGTIGSDPVSYTHLGHPDFVFLNKKIAIFVDGCFWHGHDCRNTKPKDNQEYWDKKRERNMKHDKEITEYFENRGWTVIRIWECELKNKKALEKLKCIY